jgi:mycothiol synthase
MTGVDRAHRGRGIALALKRATIAYAIATGVEVMETHNDSRNQPMLAINQALGYRPGIGITEVKRSIDR